MARTTRRVPQSHGDMGFHFGVVAGEMGFSEHLILTGDKVEDRKRMKAYEQRMVEFVENKLREQGLTYEQATQEAKPNRA